MKDILYKEDTKKKWLIKVLGYGSFVFNGTEEEAEEMRQHKARWERAVATKEEQK